ncbi:hypothetical protein DPMN_168609 [Dreissena polymorpha]|uniref:Uncharacterized protein n=1 Tax=Dreissena polymorpha TaxID=45954 RepID=A0A9D4F5W7_DREPO|nr:hypothetical protein DPMN_168609 [Dreissena polymorpha]
MKRSRVSVLGVYGGDLKKAPTVGIEPETSRSLGGHHIHYTTAILKQHGLVWAINNGKFAATSPHIKFEEGLPRDPNTNVL